MISRLADRAFVITASIAAVIVAYYLNAPVDLRSIISYIKTGTGRA